MSSFLIDSHGNFTNIFKLKKELSSLLTLRVGEESRYLLLKREDDNSFLFSSKTEPRFMCKNGKIITEENKLVYFKHKNHKLLLVTEDDIEPSTFKDYVNEVINCGEEKLYPLDKKIARLVYWFIIDYGDQYFLESFIINNKIDKKDTVLRFFRGKTDLKVNFSFEEILKETEKAKNKYDKSLEENENEYISLICATHTMLGNFQYKYDLKNPHYDPIQALKDLIIEEIQNNT